MWEGSKMLKVVDQEVVFESPVQFGFLALMKQDCNCNQS